METRTVADVIAELKRAPGVVMLHVTCTDGAEPKKVPIPKSRQKWQSLTKLLGGLDWLSIEGRDKDGQVLVVIEESDDDDDVDEESKTVRALAGLVRVVTGAQDMALKRNNEYFGTLMTSCNALLETLTKRVVALENMYAGNLRLVQDVLGHGESDGMSPMSSKLLDLIGPELIRKYMAPSPPAAQPKANGGK